MADDPPSGVVSSMRGQRRLRKSPTDNGGVTHKERGRTGASRSVPDGPPGAHMLRLRLHPAISFSRHNECEAFHIRAEDKTARAARPFRE
jgi:hypothetical protein